MDKGNWATALLLLPQEDPLARSPFGGGAVELEGIYRYRKALTELRNKSLLKNRKPEEAADGVKDELLEYDEKRKPVKKKKVGGKKSGRKEE